MKLKKFKCFLRLLLLLGIIIFIIYTLSFCTGIKTTKDGIEYRIEDDKVIITGYKGSSDHLIIPSTIKKREVKVINRRAFYNNGNLKSVILPSSVNAIGYDAFSKCNNLDYVHIPSSVTKVEKEAFNNCNKITIYTEHNTVPSGWKKMFGEDGDPNRNHVFLGVTPDKFVSQNGYHYYFENEGYTLSKIPNGITDIVIPNLVNFDRIDYPVKSIGKYVNRFNKSMESLEISDGITHIGEYAFLDSTKLETVIFSENLVEIQNSSFEYCISLETVNLPSNIEAIGDYAFAHCTSLTNLTLPDNLQEIKDFAFYNCNSMQDIVFPEGLLSIGSLAFGFCESLESINLPESLISIGSLAFEHCINVTSIVMGDNVIELGFGAFRFCYNLENIYLSKSIEIIKSWTFYKCNALNSIIIPNSVAEIKAGAFLSCETLSSVTLPDGLINIYDDAFSNSNAINEFIICDTNANFFTDAGVLYNKERTELILYPEAKSSSSYLISSEVTEINLSSLTANQHLEEIIVEESNEHFSSHDGVLYNKYKTELIAYPKYKITENFTIVESVKIINVADLNASVSLKNINVDVNNTEFASVNGILYNKEITELLAYPLAKTDEIYVLPDSLKIVDSYLYTYSNNFFANKISIFNSNIKEIIANEENENFSSIDGVLYNKEITKMILYPMGKTDVSYNVPATVSTINYYALAWVDHLESITVDSGNEDYISFDGVLYKKFGDDGITLNIYPSAKIDTEYAWYFYTSSIYSEIILLGYTFEDSYIYNYNLQEIYIIYGDDYNPSTITKFINSFIFSIKGNMKIFNELNQKDFLNYLSVSNLNLDEIDGYDINVLLCNQVPIVWGYKKY